MYSPKIVQKFILKIYIYNMITSIADDKKNIKTNKFDVPLKQN